MDKEFIPYQQALELKELGFEEPCLSYYEGESFSYHLASIKGDDYIIPAPLYQQAFRWFRDKYNIDAWVQPFTSEKSSGRLYLPDESYSYFIFMDGIWVDDKVDFLEPKEAEIACLKKLIEIVKERL